MFYSSNWPSGLQNSSGSATFQSGSQGVSWASSGLTPGLLALLAALTFNFAKPLCFTGQTGPPVSKTRAGAPLFKQVLGANAASVRAEVQSSRVEATSIGQARLEHAEFARGCRKVTDVEATSIGHALLEHADFACSVGSRAKFEFGVRKVCSNLDTKGLSVTAHLGTDWIHQLNLRAWYARAHTSNK